MAHQEFELGKVVQLKSGGPDMTIVAVNEADEIWFYECHWFQKQGKGRYELGKEWFPGFALKKA